MVKWYGGKKEVSKSTSSNLNLAESQNNVYLLLRLHSDQHQPAEVLVATLQVILAWCLTSNIRVLNQSSFLCWHGQEILPPDCSRAELLSKHPAQLGLIDWLKSRRMNCQPGQETPWLCTFLLWHDIRGQERGWSVKKKSCYDVMKIRKCVFDQSQSSAVGSESKYYREVS